MESNHTRVYTVELGESGPGTDSDVRFLGVFSSLDNALGFCWSADGRAYLEHPPSGARSAFIVAEMGLDSRGRYQTRYVADDGSLHRDWPYEGVGAAARLRAPDTDLDAGRAPDAGSGLDL